MLCADSHAARQSGTRRGGRAWRERSAQLETLVHRGGGRSIVLGGEGQIPVAAKLVAYL